MESTLTILQILLMGSNPSTHICCTFLDINECAMNRDTCVEGQTCENTVGSFMCRRTISCGTGYTLDQSSQQCLGRNKRTIEFFIDLVS